MGQQARLEPAPNANGRGDRGMHAAQSYAFSDLVRADPSRKVTII
jgi:hypothetical protein